MPTQKKESTLQRLKRNLDESLHYGDLISQDLTTHSKLKKERFEKIKHEWFYFSYSYLRAAKTLLETALNKEDLDTRLNLVPALYNFRHSIELCLKYLHISTGGGYFKEHDIALLYEQVLKRLRTNLNSNILQFISERSLKNITKEQMESLINDEIETLSSMVNKYYFQTPLQKSLGGDGYFIIDHENEVFRYPEAKNVTFYFHSIHILNLPKKDLELILSNVDEMEFILTLFFSLLKSNGKES